MASKKRITSLMATLLLCFFHLHSSDGIQESHHHPNKMIQVTDRSTLYPKSKKVMNMVLSSEKKQGILEMNDQIQTPYSATRRTLKGGGGGGGGRGFGGGGRGVSQGSRGMGYGTVPFSHAGSGQNHKKNGGSNRNAAKSGTVVLFIASALYGLMVFAS